MRRRSFVVLRNYELVERLSVGDETELFLVRFAGEHGFRRHVVLKRLLDDRQTQTFIGDAKLAAKLSHAKIVQTLELGRIDDVPYVALEYVDGIDLLGFLHELARTRHMLPPAVAVFVAHELLDALDYAHTCDGGPAIVHGRLSPTKVLLGGAGEVKLCDFGLPRAFDLARGDFGHMSPEQVSEQPVDARSDVFGVGVLLAEMLTCRRLFAARHELDVLLAVRDVRLSRLDERPFESELLAIVRKALAKRPDERWPSAAAFRDALDEWSFRHRAQRAKQTLGTLVTSVRDAVDDWRRTGAHATPEFDDLPDLLDAPMIPPRPRTVSPKAITIPAKLAKGSTQMVPLPKPPEDFARGTEKGARGTGESKPLVRPVEKPAFAADTIPVTKLPHPHLIARSAAGTAGASLQELLPTRAPLQARSHATQPLSATQLATVAPPRAPVLAALEHVADEIGDLARSPLVRVLFHLIRARATGLLTVTNDSVRKDIYLRDGQLAGVWSNDSAELFGNYLVAQRVVSDGELSMALATMSYYGGKIGDTLVGLGLVTRVEVFRHLTKHARAKVVDACTWSSGSYAWYAGKQDPHEAFPLEAENFTMLGDAALALPHATVDGWLAMYRDDRAVLVKTHRISPDVFGVRGAFNVLDSVDDARTLGDVVERQPDRAHAARLLYLFVACDLVRVA